MGILIPLRVLPIIYSVYCLFLCFSLCSIYSYNDSMCAFPFFVCLAAIQNNLALGYALKNPNRARLPSLCQENVFPRYNVFLNHCGIDVKESVASLIFHNLKNKGLRVFLDKNSIQVGDNIPLSIEEAIHSASVHVVIFSVNYAESIWCLKELELIRKTGAPIIPVFYGVEPSELRMRDENGVFAQAFRMHQHIRNFELKTLEEWKKALYQVSSIKGFIFTGDEGELLEEIARNVAEHINNLEFQPKAVTEDLKGRTVEDMDAIDNTIFTEL